jgi:hypothetical protein
MGFFVDHLPCSSFGIEHHDVALIDTIERATFDVERDSRLRKVRKLNLLLYDIATIGVCLASQYRRAASDFERPQLKVSRRSISQLRCLIRSHGIDQPCCAVLSEIVDTFCIDKPFCPVAIIALAAVELT